MAILLDKMPRFFNLIPRHRTFECIDQNAIILQILTQIRVFKTPMFPGFGDVARRVHRPILAGDFFDHVLDMAGEAAFPIRCSEEQAALASLIATQAHCRIDCCPFYAIEFERHIGFFRIRQTKH